METLILSRGAVAAVASMNDAVAAVEAAFRAHGSGQADMPPKVYLDVQAHDGDFRAMPAYMDGAAGVKWVNSHPMNPARHKLPSVMGLFILSDPATAYPLAVMDATYLTALRTGAAGGVASKVLSPAPKTIGFVGSGVQSRFLLAAHRVVFGESFEVLTSDIDDAAAKRFAEEVGGRATSIEEASGCDIVNTSTPSRVPVVRYPWIRQGCHINAMGADAPGKQELDVGILRTARIYIDEAHQAEGSGEINVPLRDKMIDRDQIAGTLGHALLGMAPVNQAETTVFDSTGLAIQDVAVAKRIYESAKQKGIGTPVDLIGVG